jgi:hypothetical protein
MAIRQRGLVLVTLRKPIEIGEAIGGRKRRAGRFPAGHFEETLCPRGRLKEVEGAVWQPFAEIDLAFVLESAELVGCDDRPVSPIGPRRERSSRLPQGTVFQIALGVAREEALGRLPFTPRMAPIKAWNPGRNRGPAAPRPDSSCRDCQRFPEDPDRRVKTDLPPSANRGTA